MIKTTFNLFIVGLAAVLIPFIGACSGGGGGGAGGVSALKGVWFGAGYDEQVLKFAEYEIVVDGDRRITRISADGVDQGITGSIKKTSSKVVFSFSLSNGNDGGFILDGDKNYAFLASESEDFFAVLQKSAAGMPTYVPSDVLNKSYSGTGVEVDDDFDLEQTSSSTLQTFGDGGFSGSSGATSFNHAAGGQLAVYDIDYGVWLGQYESNGPGGFSGGQVALFLSPDKKFIGAWACDSMGTYPGDCGFFGWKLN